MNDNHNNPFSWAAQKADPAFQADLEEQVMARLYEKFSNDEVNLKMTNIKRKNSTTSRIPITLAAAVLSIIAGSIFLLSNMNTPNDSALQPLSQPELTITALVELMTSTANGEMATSTPVLSAVNLSTPTIIPWPTLVPTSTETASSTPVPTATPGAMTAQILHQEWQPAAVPIVVAAQDILPGVEVTEHMITLTFWPDSLSNDADMNGFFSTIDSVIGKVTTQHIWRWQPMNADMVETLPIDSTERVDIAIHIDKFTPLRFTPTSGERVTIYAAISPEDVDDQFKAIYPGAEEIAGDNLTSIQIVAAQNAIVDQFDSAGNSGTTPPMILLNVTEEESALLIWLVESETTMTLVPSIPDTDPGNIVPYYPPHERFVGDYSLLRTDDPATTVIIIPSEADGIMLDNFMPQFTSTGAKIISFDVIAQIGTYSYTDETGIRQSGTSARLLLPERYATLIDDLTNAGIDYRYTILPLQFAAGD